MDRIKAAFGFGKRAGEGFYPTDETLRLILSGEERDFIFLTIRRQKLKITLCFSYLFIFAAIYYGFFEFYYIDYVDQYAKNPAGLEPDEYYGGMSRLARWGSTALTIAALAVPIAAALILDGTYRWIKFSRYHRDHRAFLRKYDREQLYYGP